MGNERADMSKTYQRKCKRCECEFATYHGGQLYCSHECRLPPKEPLEGRACVQCKRVYNATHRRQRICSNECRRERIAEYNRQYRQHCRGKYDYHVRAQKSCYSPAVAKLRKAVRTPEEGARVLAMAVLED